MSNEIAKPEKNVIKYVENALDLAEKLFTLDLRPLQILHLDDHLIYAKGVAKCIREKHPNVIIKNIIDGNDALEYVKFALENCITIDLIITDVNHPGIDGLKFCVAVKELEKRHLISIPIIFITMCYKEEFLLQMEALPMVKFLSKATWAEEINLAIENLT